MKSIVLLALSLWMAAPFYAQELPKDDEGMVMYTEVVQADGMTKEELLKNAQKWFSANFKSDRNQVVEGFTISDNHNIIVKKGSKDAGGVNYDIRIMIKDGRYKFEFTNFVHKDYEQSVGSGGKLERDEPKDGFSQKLWDDMKVQVSKEVEALIASLKKTMVAKDATKNDDW